MRDVLSIDLVKTIASLFGSDAISDKHSSVSEEPGISHPWLHVILWWRSLQTFSTHPSLFAHDIGQETCMAICILSFSRGIKG